jgi:hypothetical protein
MVTPKIDLTGIMLPFSLSPQEQEIKNYKEFYKTYLYDAKDRANAQLKLNALCKKASALPADILMTNQKQVDDLLWEFESVLNNIFPKSFCSIIKNVRHLRLQILHIPEIIFFLLF